MGLLDRLFRRGLPQDEPIAYPIGYHREGDDQIIVESSYLARWVEQYGDPVTAVTKMLAFLKGQYPEVSKFLVRK